MESKIYTLQHGDYRCQVMIEEVNRLMNADRFAANAVNFERVLPSGHSESIDPPIGEVHGTTPEQALKNLQAALTDWAAKEITLERDKHRSPS